MKPSDDELLEFLIKLEEIQSKFNEESDEGSSSDLVIHDNITLHNSSDLNFIHSNPFITINYGWSSYEEGSSTELKINLDTLETSYNEKTSSVYGNYTNEHTKIYSSLNDIYDEYFKNLIN